MMKTKFRIIYLVLAGLALSLGLIPLAGAEEPATGLSNYCSPFDLAYSPDGSMIAVSDVTKAKLYIINATSGSVARTVSLNGLPKGVAWSGNTRVYVAEYDAGTVAEVDPANGSILRRITTGRKPLGVAIASGKLCVSDFGLSKVSIVDLTSGTVTKDIPVTSYPYFITSTSTGTYAIVGHATPSGNALSGGFASTLTFIDMNAGTVAANIKLPAGSGNVRKIVCSPDGKWAYVTHTLGRITYPTTQITKGWVMTNAFSIIDLAQRNVYTTLFLDTLYQGAADPWGLAISSNSNTLWASISGTHYLYKIDLSTLHSLLTGNVPGRSGGDPTMFNRNKQGYNKPYSDVWFAVKANPAANRSRLKNDLGALYSAGLMTRIKLPGQGPRGISISADGSKVAVGSYFAGQVYLINTSNNSLAQTITLGTQPAEDAVRRGERTFFDASTTTQQWLSCGSCHPEGRADGFNWDMPNDGVGNSKNTKSMFKAFDTPPAMWRGIRESAEVGVTAGFKFIKFKMPTTTETGDVGAYIKGFNEEPSPYLNADGSVTAAAQAGKTLFESPDTGCSSCHTGPYLTDLKIHDVGTVDANDIDGNYVTPPLIELWRAAPYLHDGSAATMRDVLTTRNIGDRHGRTSQLTSAQLDQLAAYLLQVSAAGGTFTPTPTPTPTPTDPTPTPTPTSTSNPNPIWTGGPYTLNGTTDYVDLPDGITGNLNDFTVSCWVNLNTLTNWVRIFDFGGDSNVFMMLTPSSATTTYPYFAITTSGNSGEQGLNGKSVMPTGSWQHFVVVKNGDTGILYINNQEVDRNLGMTLKPSDLGNTLNNYLGRSQWTQDPYLNGKVDKFKLYNRAVTTAEVGVLYADCPGCTGKKGDVNGDGNVSIVDAMLIAQYVSGLNPPNFNVANADVNCDGNVNINDALLVARYAAGLVTSLGC